MGPHVAATAATTSLTQPSSPSASPASFPRLSPSAAAAAAAPHVQAVKRGADRSTAKAFLDRALRLPTRRKNSENTT